MSLKTACARYGQGHFENRLMLMDRSSNYLEGGGKCSVKGVVNGEMGNNHCPNFFGNLFLKKLTEGALRVDFDGWDFIRMAS